MDKEKRNEMEPRIEIESKVYFERGRLPKVRENLGKLGAFQKEGNEGQLFEMNVYHDTSEGGPIPGRRIVIKNMVVKNGRVAEATLVWEDEEHKPHQTQIWSLHENEDVVKNAAFMLGLFGVTRKAEQEGRFFSFGKTRSTGGKELKERQEISRIRKVQKGKEVVGATWAWKGPRLDEDRQVKSMHEIEIGIGDAETIIFLLEKGLEAGVVERMEKKKEVWKIPWPEGTVEICLNELPILRRTCGIFCEAEGPSGEVVLGVINELGLASGAATSDTYEDLLERWCQKHHLDYDQALQNFTFEGEEKLAREMPGLFSLT